MKLIDITAPTEICVSLDDAKAQLSILSDDSHDARILRLIKAATRQAEAHCGMRAMTQTVRLELDAFPAGELGLCVHPVASITTVAYDDEAGAAQTLVLNTGYYADIAGLYPRILPVTSWPATSASKPGCVRITMVVGHASPDLVPEDFTLAVLMRTAELFDNPTESVQGGTSPTLVGYDALLAPYKRGGI